ncbi:HAD domain-containing protein [Kitasatospora griseola]|uniref:HAD domain-containing protein n=1 Tax=Kitasatospora griseola TaxID=2064 RepID=UPI0036DBE7B6
MESPPPLLPQLPLLYLDVDGPLIPFGGDPARHRTHLTERRVRELTGGSNPLLTRVNPALGRQLAALPCRLIWATTWFDDANACLAPLLGLPPLPVLPDPPFDASDPAPGVHWKPPALVAHAAGTPFAWVDDEIAEHDREWVAQHHLGPALLHRIDPEVGLTERDFIVLADWLRNPT